jgi:uncharacterized protein DUF4268
MAELGNIKTGSIQSEWSMEAHFSQWLAEEDNLRLLASALGLEDDDLELKDTEFKVGPYRADIVAQGASSERYVIIENQYGKTDHDHLGKLLTYGSNLDAGTLVWIAEAFTEEHKKAVDWLNDNTGEELLFFGVRAELLQIDDSLPAINYDVVCRPNTIVKQIRASTKPLSINQQKQRAFWELVSSTIIDKGILQKTQAARPQYWFNVGLGKNGIYLSNIVSMTKNCLRTRVYITIDGAYEQLEQQKKFIEDQLGQLVWKPNAGKKTQLIYIERQADMSDEDKWPECVDWMTDQIGKFREVFMPLVKPL